MIGKVGLVLKIDSNGDVLVSFGHHAFLFAPASCIPAPDLKPDALGIETDRQEPQISAQATMGDTKKDSTAETSTEAEKSMFSVSCASSLEHSPLRNQVT